MKRYVTRNTTEAALAEANSYIEAMTKAMNAVLRDPPELTVAEARELMLSQEFLVIPSIQFAVESQLAQQGETP